MPVLKALKKFTYDKVKLRPGDLFKCKDKFVPVLVRQGVATRPDVSAQTYSTRDMEPKRVVELDKLEAESPDYSTMTVQQLREIASQKEVYLPGGYIPKNTLIDILTKA